MAGRIEDYALIGDMQTAALVCRDGTVDWLCLPRFDSHAVFAGLLGTEEHGFWRLGPPTRPTREPPAAARRRYRGDSLILESEWDTPRGTVRVIDFMPPRDGAPQLIRIVEGVSGRVPMRSALRMRFSLRPGRALGAQGTTAAHGRRRRARLGLARHRRRDVRQGPDHVLRLHRRPGRPDRVHHPLGALAQAAARRCPSRSSRWRRPRTSGASGSSSARTTAPTARPWSAR